VTAFICTITASYAVVTTDSLCVWLDGQIRPVSKLRVLPGSHAVLCGSGNAGALIEWGNVLSVWDAESTIREIIGTAPAALAALWQALPDCGRAQGLRVLHLGWQEGGPVAAVHEWPEFAPRYLPVGRGHTCQPAPDTGGPGYDKLRAAWAPAAAGVGIDEFHVSVLCNQKWSLDQGHVTGLVPGTKIGGKICSARVDAQGILTRVIGELP
jgi:hypothetical protein